MIIRPHMNTLGEIHQCLGGDMLKFSSPQLRERIPLRLMLVVFNASCRPLISRTPWTTFRKDLGVSFRSSRSCSASMVVITSSHCGTGPASVGSLRPVCTSVGVCRASGTCPILTDRSGYPKILDMSTNKVLDWPSDCVNAHWIPLQSFGWRYYPEGKGIQSTTLCWLSQSATHQTKWSWMSETREGKSKVKIGGKR